jgi:hypothetical protein
MCWDSTQSQRTQTVACDLLCIFMPNITHTLASTGVSETLVLNMSTLTWSVVSTVEGRVPLASEVYLLNSIQRLLVKMIFLGC